jgi:hypothetical protein
MSTWRFEVVSGVGAGIVVAVLARLAGATPLDGALLGAAFAVAWIITGLLLRRSRRR